jgi:hypothetical protein
MSEFVLSTTTTVKGTVKAKLPVPGKADSWKEITFKAEFNVPEHDGNRVLKDDEILDQRLTAVDFGNLKLAVTGPNGDPLEPIDIARRNRYCRNAIVRFYVDNVSTKNIEAGN